jgi:hypothetical protein
MRRGLFAAALLLLTGLAQAQRITVDLPKTPPADRDAVLATMGQDPAMRPQVLSDLLDYDLCTLSAPDGSHLIDAKAPDGSAYSPIFTSIARLRAVYGADQVPNCSQGRLILTYLRDKRVVFDPGGADTVAWQPEEVMRILKAGHVPIPVESQARTPDAVPPALMAGLQRICRDLPAVAKASLVVVDWPACKTSSWRLTVYAGDDLDRARLDRVVHDVFDRVDTGRLPLEIVVWPVLAGTPPGVAVCAG